MTLTHILIFSLLALVYSAVIPARLRGWILMGGSVIAIYWLQPALPIRRLDFALPSATLILTILIWMFTRQNPWQREDKAALGVAIALVIALSLTRYLIPELRPTPSRPPDIVTVMLAIAVVMAVGTVLARLGRGWMALVFIIVVFVIFKTETLATQLSAQLRSLTGQSVDLANAADLQWLGFSYVAFRLIHLLRDRQMNTLPALSLREHITYVIFFPAFTAGPIDRAERFVEDDRALPALTGLDASRWTQGIGRIVIGIGKKFVLADSLALIALNQTNANQAESAFALLLLLYGYAFRLYLDFSGYSDIAIGLGYLFGIRLPENFNRPYIKTSITSFWQSWHITLSDWVRFYVFSPLSRSLLRRKPRPHPTVIVFITQLATMITIGLWHGISINFFIWGVWHGVGLFIHKVWTERTRSYYLKLNQRPRLKMLWSAAGILLTFHFVMLGWIWFSLPDFATASDVFLQLFGMN